MYISVVIHTFLVKQPIYTCGFTATRHKSTQVLCVKYVPLLSHIYVSFVATFIHLWCEWGSPQEYASFVRQICKSLLSYIYVSFVATFLHLWCHWGSPQECASFVCPVSLLSYIYVCFVATFIHLWCHWGSPQEYASFVCQIYASLLSYP